MLRQAGTPVLPVVLTDQATCDALAGNADDDEAGFTATLPFSTTLLALAAIRVAKRKLHEGTDIGPLTCVGAAVLDASTYWTMVRCSACKSSLLHSLACHVSVDLLSPAITIVCNKAAQDLRR
jgi:hypothetical protein